ncbi:MAG: hypothetical protein AB8B53_04765 [Flavobacteriales bacterium]
MTRLLYITFIVLIWASCTLDESFHFNSEWSGRYESTFDISGLTDPLEEGVDSESSSTPLEQEKVDELVRKLNSTPGISQASVAQDMEANTLTFAYSFEDIESLNRLNAKDLLSKEESPLGSMGRWKMKAKGSKKFTMTMEPEEPAQGDNSEEMMQMGEMLQITTKLNFHMPIKKLKSEVAIKGSKSNQIIIIYTMADLWDQDKNWDVNVKF